MTDLISKHGTGSHARDRASFDAAPIAMWQEDFSGVAEACRDLRREGVADLRAELAQNPDLLKALVASIVVVDVNQAAVDLVGASSRDDLIGPIATVLLSEGAYESFMEQIVAVWEGRQQLEITLKGANFDGNEMDCSMSWAAPLVDNEPDYSHVVVVIKNVTDRLRAERRIQEHAQQLSGLLAMGRQITSSLDLETILSEINSATVDLVGADESLLLLFDPEAKTLAHAVGRNYPEDHLAAHSYEEISQGLSGIVVETGESAFSADISTDVRNRGLAAKRAQNFPGTSVAVAPIISDDVVIGTLTALNNPPSRQLSEAELTVVESLAAYAAVAIQNGRLFEDVTQAHRELQLTQAKLLQAQKLESIGSLAAGIAHEINTPIQYVADNTRFLAEAYDAIATVLAAADELAAAAAGSGDVVAAARKLAEVKTQEDYDFMVEEIPLALEQSLEGVDRVASIVRAMKEFAHPGAESKVGVDINRSLTTTAEVSRSEWKYCADIDFELDNSLPLVPALAGPLNQVFLILIVNAAQAIAAASNGNGMGSIKVTTTSDGEFAEIRIADNGPGVPAEIVDRIFDPFFTTKEVGEGSGQGLSIARSVIVERHGGDLYYDEEGEGATFVMRLPFSSSGDSTEETDR